MAYNPMSIHNLLNDTPERHISTPSAETLNCKEAFLTHSELKQNAVQQQMSESRPIPNEQFDSPRTSTSTMMSLDSPQKSCDYSSPLLTPKSESESSLSDASLMTPETSPEPVSSSRKITGRRLSSPGQTKKLDKRAIRARIGHGIRPVYSKEEFDFLWFCKIDLNLAWEDIKFIYPQLFPKQAGDRKGEDGEYGGLQCKVYRLHAEINKKLKKEHKAPSPGGKSQGIDMFQPIAPERQRAKTIEARLVDGVCGREPQRRYPWMPDLANRFLPTEEARRILRWSQQDCANEVFVRSRL